jgi:signal transduction histidine kinase/CheY-like chemotaxis protein
VTDDVFLDPEDTSGSLEPTPAYGGLVPSPDARVCLLVLSGEHSGRTFVLDRKETSIGRGVEAGIRLDIAEVSRRHATIGPDATGTFHLRDLGSRNGTKVNGVRVQEKPLEFGDRIMLGEGVVLVFTLVDHNEEELKNAQKLEAIGTLAGGIAHDFNNLLAVLLTNISYLRGLPSSATLGDPSVGSALDDADSAGKRAMDLVRELLAFARRGKYDERPVHISVLMSEAVRALECSIGTNIEIRADIERDLAVVGDHGQLRQAVMSLCHYARDAMPEGGRLLLRARSVPSKDLLPAMRRRGVMRAVQLSFSDSGAGLDEPTRRRIFEPFFSRHILGIGTGLGLAMVYGIIKNHGGEIDVSSAHGVGTTFHVHLPAARIHVQHPTPALGSRKLEGTKVVLLVDDETLVRRGAARLFRQLGWEVIQASGGDEAIEIYRVHGERIDLVVLDLMMPEKDGETTFRELVELDPAVRVLISSGYSHDDRARAIVQAGALGFLQKPYDRDALEEALSRALDGQAR